jgi:acetyltransferase-like isoleucine patch superfamily enzyme
LQKNIINKIRVFYKSFYFNCKYFGFTTALKLPVLINYNVSFNTLRGEVKLNCPLKRGIVRIGFPYIGIANEKYIRTVLELKGKIIFNGEAKIGSGSRISVGETGILEFGSNFAITSESTLICFKNIKFGSDCLLSWDILIMDTDFHSISYQDCNNSVITENILIGDKVWIGCKSLILKGTVVRDNSVVAALSKLNSKYEESNVLITGNPAKAIKKIKDWNY